MARGIANTPADFWKHVKKTPQCWTWTGKPDATGYGRFGIGGKVKRAPRFSWELIHKKSPGKKWVLHKCNNPICVNPKHLYLGSPQNNTDDMIASRRQCIGEDQPLAKLTNVKIKTIRQLYSAGKISYRKLAIQFKVSRQLMLDILHRKRWKHVA